MEYWNIGVLEYWNIGILEYWNIGVEYWNIGVSITYGMSVHSIKLSSLYDVHVYVCVNLTHRLSCMCELNSQTVRSYSPRMYVKRYSVLYAHT